MQFYWLHHNSSSTGNQYMAYIYRPKVWDDFPIHLNIYIYMRSPYLGSLNGHNGVAGRFSPSTLWPTHRLLNILPIACRGRAIFLMWTSHQALSGSFTLYFPLPLSLPSSTEPARVRSIIHITTFQIETGAGNRLGAGEGSWSFALSYSVSGESDLNSSEQGFLCFFLCLQELVPEYLVSRVPAGTPTGLKRSASHC